MPGHPIPITTKAHTRPISAYHNSQITEGKKNTTHLDFHLKNNPQLLEMQMLYKYHIEEHNITSLLFQLAYSLQ